MTDKKTEALKLALEALEYIDRQDNDRDFLSPEECCDLDDAITAIREALEEQPAQDQGQSCYCSECERLSKELAAFKAQQQCMEHGECFGGECIYPAQQPAQQQEPQPPYEFERYVAGSLRAQGVRVGRATNLADAMRIAARICPPANPPSAPTVLVYTTPPYEATPLASQRSVKPLTDVAIWNTYKNLWMLHAAEEPRLAGDILKFARAIEAAHGITGESK